MASPCENVPNINNSLTGGGPLRPTDLAGQTLTLLLGSLQADNAVYRLYSQNGSNHTRKSADTCILFKHNYKP